QEVYGMAAPLRSTLGFVPTSCSYDPRMSAGMVGTPLLMGSRSPLANVKPFELNRVPTTSRQGRFNRLATFLLGTLAQRRGGWQAFFATPWLPDGVARPAPTVLRVQKGGTHRCQKGRPPVLLSVMHVNTSRRLGRVSN